MVRVVAVATPRAPAISNFEIFREKEIRRGESTPA